MVWLPSSPRSSYDETSDVPTIQLLSHCGISIFASANSAVASLLNCALPLVTVKDLVGRHREMVLFMRLSLLCDLRALFLLSTECGHKLSCMKGAHRNDFRHV